MQYGMVVGPLDLPVSCFETDLLISYWISLPHFLMAMAISNAPPDQDLVILTDSMNVIQALLAWGRDIANPTLSINENLSLAHYHK